MLTKLKRLFTHQPPASPSAPPQLICPKDLLLVPYCQWRTGKKCMFRARYDMCIGVWGKGLGR